MKNKTKSSQLPTIICFVLILIWMNLFTNLFNDDLWFLEVSTDKGFLPFLLWRYDVWTSRLFIEGFLIFFSKHFWLWKIINSLILTGFLYLIDYYTTDLLGKKVNQLFLFLALFTFIPLEQLNGAGWIATSTNYLWPVTAALFGFYPFYQKVKGRPINRWIAGLSYLSLFFACNQELVAVCVFAWFGIFGLYELVKTKKVNITWLIPVIIAIASLLFILSTPGNDARMTQEIAHWFPNFSKLSMIQKFYLGVSSTFGILFSGGNYLFDIFLGLLALASIIRQQSILDKCIGIAPFIIILISLITSKIERFSIYHEKLMHAQFSHIVFLALACFFALLFIILYRLAQPSLIHISIIYLLFLMGLFSRFSLGFSPSVWSSGDRTFFIFNTCLLLISGFLFAVIQKNISIYQITKYFLYIAGIFITFRIALIYFGII